MSPRSGARDDRVDALRGLALIVVFGAEWAPTVSSFDSRGLLSTLALPLFAVLMGVGAELGDTGPRRIVQAFVRAGVRAAVVIGFGMLLYSKGAPQADVLFALALPVLVSPLLVRLGERSLMLVGGVLWAAGPWLGAAVRPTVRDARARGDELTVRLWDALCTGTQWRATNVLVWVCVGIVIARLVARTGRQRRTRGAAVVGAALVVVAAVLWAARLDGRIQFAPHDGSRIEVVFAAAAAGGVVALVLGLVPVPTALPGLATAGSMSLSVWLVHVWYVRQLLPALGNPGPWATFAGLVAVGLILPALWRSLVTREPLARGPVEGPTRLVTNVFR